jgi:hypothetical protein
MMNRTFTTLLSIGALLLASCGGGSDGSMQLGGIQGSGIASGPITGFGSIFVNGIEYSTSGAQIRIEGQSGTESQLRVGQIVTLKGRVNSDGKTGSATEVSFNDSVQGPVTQLNVAGGTFVVLGQTVRVTGSTLFDDNLQPASIEGLQQAGLIVEVSGFPNATGEIIASRIEGKSAGTGLEVTGTVGSLDTVARTFRINALTVDYSGVAPEGTLADGKIVEVKGTSFTTSGALRATRVEVSSGFGGAANDTAEIEGVITRFTSNADFELNGQRVTTDSSTQFALNGLTLGLNVKVEVEGTFNASGVLVARKVDVKLDNSSRVRGLVESVTAQSNSLRVVGVNVTTSVATELEDKSSLQLRPFRLTDLRTGDYVEVRGIEAQSGGISAAILERMNPDNKTFLQGTVRNVSEPSLSVLGVSVTTNASTQFRGTDDGALTSAQFFSQAANHLVKVRGSVFSGAFIADQAELEN